MVENEQIGGDALDAFRTMVKTDLKVEGGKVTTKSYHEANIKAVKDFIYSICIVSLMTQTTFRFLNKTGYSATPIAENAFLAITNASKTGKELREMIKGRYAGSNNYNLQQTRSPITNRFALGAIMGLDFYTLTDAKREQVHTMLQLANLATTGIQGSGQVSVQLSLPRSSQLPIQEALRTFYYMHQHLQQSNILSAYTPTVAPLLLLIQNWITADGPS